MRFVPYPRTPCAVRRFFPSYRKTRSAEVLDLKLLQKNPEVVAAALAKRHSPLNMRTFEELDNKRRELLAQVEALKAERNRASAEVARLKRNGEDAEAFIASLSDLSSRISALDSATEAVKADLADWMLTVPNIPDPSVPDGVDENDNVEVHRWGTPREFDFEVKNHWDLSNDNGGLDFERGAKLAGSRFTVSWGWAARLERALVCFYLDFHHEQGRTEILPPLMVRLTWSTATVCTAPASFPNSRKISSRLRIGNTT